MQLIVVLGLIAKLALVSGDCDMGQTVQDFDIKKFPGTWYFLYHNPGHEYDYLECPIDIYDVPVGNSSRMVSYVLAGKQRRVIASTGYLLDWNSTGYSQKFDKHSKWNGRVYILAVHYNRYVIGKLYILGSDKVHIFVAFRRARPDNATMEDVKKALSCNDIDFNQLQYWNPDRCLDLKEGVKNT